MKVNMSGFVNCGVVKDCLMYVFGTTL